MDNHRPFSQEKLNEIFKISPLKPDRVISRECSWLEFKESFGWASIAKYLRSCAAFANAKGGYIVFGIANQPHTLKGLKGKNLEHFETLDPEQMSKHFNDHFAPEIEWDIQQYELNGNIYGLIYIHESNNKPVVCCKDSGKELKEGDIYYRYRGRTERVKYPELRSILDSKREQEQQLWMHHLANIARIGVQDAGVFDLQTGQITGSGGSFLIDESLLSQLSFIKEGEFSEVKGKPALKLIGSVSPIGSIPIGVGKKQIVKTKGIRVADIVGSFLKHDQVPEPHEFIKQICFENTAFLPCYYYMHCAGLDYRAYQKSINSKDDSACWGFFCCQKEASICGATAQQIFESSAFQWRSRVLPTGNTWAHSARSFEKLRVSKRIIKRLVQQALFIGPRCIGR
ncbi:MAG: ATP-binding protein [Deltaproteobacteria bacterium]|nr:ATP-binding protein [Deltaproteobacteria bacterium]